MKPKTKLFLSLIWRDVRDSMGFAIAGLIVFFAIGALGSLAYWVASIIGIDSEEAVGLGLVAALMSIGVIAWIIGRWKECHALPDKTP